MSGGLFDYPQQAAFGRVLPKNKVYAFGKGLLDTVPKPLC